jgi:ubiquinone/menaquinone biosynthesis C-methylase UbiE
MKKTPYYGYPLSHVLFRFLILLILVLIIIVILLLNFFIIVIFIIGLFILLLYVYFAIIFYKKKFLINRQNLLEKFINLAELKGDETVLDLGTGSGFLAIGFAKYLKNGKSYGLDKFSLKSNGLKTQIINMIKINFFGNTLKNARGNSIIEKVEKKCDFIKTDITKPLYFPDEYFKIVTSSQFFYCISKKNRLTIFKEINRVLKKDGKIIFFESKSFMGWDINEIKRFFENIGYKIRLFQDENFHKCYILVGKKSR